jgi:hypothetical protein
VWFMRYRYAEVLLIAAEAAFELGQADVAAGYLNQVRSRAGLTTALTAADITFDRIVHERRVELAFEGYQLFDMKRWRLAHVVWNGNRMTVTDLNNNIGKAAKISTMPFGVWPYRALTPAHDPNTYDWVFKVVVHVRGPGQQPGILGPRGREHHRHEQREPERDGAGHYPRAELCLCPGRPEDQRRRRYALFPDPESTALTALGFK